MKMWRTKWRWARYIRGKRAPAAHQAGVGRGAPFPFFALPTRHGHCHAGGGIFTTQQISRARETPGDRGCVPWGRARGRGGDDVSGRAPSHSLLFQPDESCLSDLDD